MTGIYLAFAAVLVSGFGARDQVTLAGLSDVQGRRPAVLIVALFVCVLTAFLPAMAADLIAPMLPENARNFLAAMALGFAGLETLVLIPRASPREPTHSLGALALVLVGFQLTDAARFLIFGVAFATNAAVPVAIGGALASAGLLALGWSCPSVALSKLVRPFRRHAGVVLIAIATYLALHALGRI